MHKRNLFILTSLLLCFHAWLFCQYRPTLDPDTYYHALAARELKTTGKFSPQKVLPISIFTKHPNDQHYGYHWLQSWFSSASFSSTSFSSDENITPLKTCQTLLTSTLLIAFFYYAKKQNPSYALWALCLLCTNIGFLSRVSIIKATPLSVLFFITFINGLCYQNLVMILLIPILFAIYHSGFLICFFPLLAFSLVEFSQVKLSQPKIRKSFLVYLLTLLGLTIGIILHPDNIEYLKFIKYQGFDIALFSHLANKIEIGNEWAAPTLKTVILSNFPIMLAALPMLSFGVVKFRKLESKQKFLLINSILIFALYLRSARFIEYLIPSILLYLLSILPSREDINKKIILPSLIFALAWFPISVNSLISKQEVIMPKSMIIWLRKNSQEGEMICNLDWTDFPELAFYLPNNKYLYGSDPRYLAFQNVKLYNQLANFLLTPNSTDLLEIEQTAECNVILVSNKMPNAYNFIKNKISEKIEFRDYVVSKSNQE